MITSRTNYNIVRIEDVIAASQGIQTLPPHAVLLTFDDAYSDHFVNVFPILKTIIFKVLFMLQ
jgi:peptidoglycan/xylan/chitin deacetylase (PgdA/CDA1 family)